MPYRADVGRISSRLRRKFGNPGRTRPQGGGRVRGEVGLLQCRCPQAVRPTMGTMRVSEAGETSKKGGSPENDAEDNGGGASSPRPPPPTSRAPAALAREHAPP